MQMLFSIRFSSLAVLLSVTVVSGQKFDGVVRDVGGGRSDAYMIPPDKANHASFLELLPSGELLMAWFSGEREGADLCSIYVAHLPPNSTQWSKALLVSRRKDYSNQNPVLFYDNDKEVLNLFHSQQKSDVSYPSLSSRESNAHIWLCQSEDGKGMNWTEPQLLFARNGSFDRNRILVTLDGGLVYPIYYAVDGDENQISAMELSDDHVNWNGYDVADSNYLVQPSVIRPVTETGELIAFFRDRRAQNIYSCVSTDMGKTWTKPEKTALPNNNAAIEAYALASGNLAIVFNPTTHNRYPIRIAVSNDGGKTWPNYRDLEPAPRAEGERGVEFMSTEYSYPSLLQSPDGYIHVSYTYNRETIKYARFMESWIYQR